MSEVRYEEATRTYEGTDVPAVDDLNLSIGDGELIVLVGPSGSGKSTALRMLAGLEPLDAGAVYIGDRNVSNVRPRDRDIAMVFQNYALYPQLSVAENIGFPLKQQGVPKEERKARVRETARILDLVPFLERKPKALSGGQRQRVAMGRAIVRQPSVYLMDEPLSNLDAKLRVQTRTEVVELQHRLGVTTVYVTHDQVEAMTMGDRVAVLKDGALQQVDVPGALYHEPANLFVAGFIGSPAMNLVRIGGNGRPLRIGGGELVFSGPAETAIGNANGDITVGFRPEAVRVGDGPLRGHIRTVEDLGPEVFVHVGVDHNGDSLSLVSKMAPPFSGQLDESVGLEIVGTTHLFAGDGSRIVSTGATLR
jgi:multiple sugar transport system ATP-binding protein